MKAPYVLRIPRAIELRLLRLRVGARKAILARLDEEVLRAGARSLSGALLEALGPAPRFYAAGYRVLFQVEHRERRVVVLELRLTYP